MQHCRQSVWQLGLKGLHDDVELRRRNAAKVSFQRPQQVITTRWQWLAVPLKVAAKAAGTGDKSKDNMRDTGERTG